MHTLTNLTHMQKTTPLILVIFLLLLTNLAAFAAVPRKPLVEMSVKEMFPDNEQLQQLALAATAGDTRKMDELAAAGTDVNAVGTDGATVAYWVTEHPNPDGFKKLLELGANANSIWRTDSGTISSLVHWTVTKTANAELDLNYLKAIFEVGKGDPNLKLPGIGTLPIEGALFANDEAVFKLLIDSGADIHRKGSQNASLVDMAGGLGNFRLALHLLEQGVDYAWNDAKGHSFVSNIRSNFTGTPRHMVTDPHDGQYMWFWRCVDFLEKRGEYLAIPAELERPQHLDDTPATSFFDGTGQKTRTQKVFLYEMGLTYPAPFWTHQFGATENLQQHFKSLGNERIYEFTPIGQSLDKWDSYQLIKGFSLPQTSFTAFVESADTYFTGQCGEEIHFEVIQKKQDQQLLHVRCTAQQTEGFLFLGKYQNTFVMVYQAWRLSAVANPEKTKARVLSDMQLITMEKGFSLFD
ncbi:ankyrin repeat domain-containing protein [Oleidesulfovibrio sp.]|uniref:ankyrin repeat domain-containing protein n=1 Tax=Oleidesulfovibrio sp. TaxID=2909707 RepID=UPI003A87420C